MNIMENIFEILKQEPMVTIIMGFLLAGLLAWILRDQIVTYVKNKYGLYSEEEVRDSVSKIYGEVVAESLIKTLKNEQDV